MADEMRVNAQDPPDEATLTVATYNIRNGVALDRASLWPVRRRALAQVLGTVDADLWGLQEVYGFQRGWMAGGPLVGFDWVGSGRNRWRMGEGNYLAARVGRLRLGDHEVRWFGSSSSRPGSKLDGARSPRVVVLARVSIDGLETLVAVTHLDAKSPDLRRASVEQLVRWLGEEGRDRPVIVMGDVNALPGSHELAPLGESGLAPVLGPDDGGTAHGFGSHDLIQIDNIWVSTHWAVGSRRVVAEAGHASDHLPVMASLTLLAG